MDIDIVDDNEMINQLFTTVANDAGFKTRSYYSAEQYLEYASSQNYIIPNIVVMTDIRMPGKSGYELINELSKTNKKQRYIVITGTPEVVNHNKVKACFYLSKPINMSKLKTIFRKLSKCKSNFTECMTADPLCISLSNLDDFKIKNWSCPQQYSP